MKSRFCLALLLLMLSAASLAETAWVTDRLRLGVHAAADTSDRAFTALNSGEAVEILERNGSFARVRLGDGREGWVRSAFLLTDEPAVLRVAKLEAERDRLTAELESLQGSGDDRSAELDALRIDAEQSRAAASTATEELQALRTEVQALRVRDARRQISVPLPWLLGLSAIALLLGASTAWWWFDRRSRQRHGGFRIY